MSSTDSPARIDTAADPRVTRIRTLARVLDSAFAIPGTKIRVGVDPIIGLFPVAGDIAGALLSGYIILASARIGAPASVVIRMLINVGIDTIVGSVPVFGDMFDVGWRANMKNVDLLEAHLGQPVKTRRASRLIVAGIVVGLLLMAAGAVAVGIIGIQFLAGLARSS
jgi:Domain of unknown function (DUF4112)